MWGTLGYFGVRASTGLAFLSACRTRTVAGEPSPPIGADTMGAGEDVSENQQTGMVTALRARNHRLIHLLSGLELNTSGSTEIFRFS